MTLVSRVVLPLVLGLGVVGCSEVHQLGSLDGTGPELDAGVTPDAWAAPGPDAFVPPQKALDLLLMIDNSNSMTEEQGSVIVALPQFVHAIATGDIDGDSLADFVPPTSIHLGIVDSDMGLGNTTGIATCDVGFGDDGLMQMIARHPASGCQMDYGGAGHFFDFAPGSSTNESAFVTGAGCVAALGTDGCGFEYELESPLKALSLVPRGDGSSPVAWTHPGYRPPVFFAGTYGHGDDPTTNGGFMRPGSVLAIVTVNDEDDCSTGNPDIFSPDLMPWNSVDLNLRCHMWADQLYPVSRYVDGFAGLRSDPSRLVYAVIAGVPTSVGGQAPEVILADPTMNEQVNPAMQNMLLPACVSPGGRGVAYPAIRMTQVAQGLNARGAHTTVQSICQTDYTTAFAGILSQIGVAL